MLSSFGMPGSGLLIVCVMVEVQRQELAEPLESGVLENHAAEALTKAYANGVLQAVAETGLAGSIFPEDFPSSLDEGLSTPLEADSDQ